MEHKTSSCSKLSLFVGEQYAHQPLGFLNHILKGDEALPALIMCSNVYKKYIYEELLQHSNDDSGPALIQKLKTLEAKKIFINIMPYKSFEHLVKDCEQEIQNLKLKTIYLDCRILMGMKYNLFFSKQSCTQITDVFYQMAQNYNCKIIVFYNIHLIEAKNKENKQNTGKLISEISEIRKHLKLYLRF